MSNDSPREASKPFGSRLEEFIRESIVGIVRGVGAAQTELADAGATIGAKLRPQAGSPERPPKSRYAARPVETDVEFDLAVTSATESSRKGKGGVQVFVLTVGAEGATQSSASEVSRLRFTVPISFPVPEPSAD